MREAPLFAMTAALLLAGCNQGAQAPDRTIQQLMADEVQPTAEIYWNSVQFISDEAGEHEIFPRTDAEWQRTRDAATKLIELAGKMKTPAYSDGRGEDWIQFSDSLAEVGRRAEQAADERSRDKVFEVGGTIYNVCTACHQVYPPAEGLPEDGAGGTA